MTTLSVLPSFAIAGRPATLAFGLTESGANFLRVWVTAAPLGSARRAELDDTEAGRLQLFSGDAAEAAAFKFEPDRGGAYTLVAQEYVKGASGFGGGYEGDPLAAPSETKVGGETTLTLRVGQRVTQKVGVGSDVATLVFWIFDQTIRPTTASEHGETTPAIVEPRSSRATMAAESAAVRSAVAALKNVAVSTAVGSIATIAANLHFAVNFHLAQGATIHNAADADNALPDGMATAVSPKTLPNVVNAMLKSLRQHMTNDRGGAGTPGVAGPDSGEYHLLFAKVNDGANAPLFSSAGDLESAYTALADIWRVHDEHRRSLAVHGTADGFAASPLPLVLVVHREFLEVLAANVPTPPVTINPGVATALSVGFQES